MWRHDENWPSCEDFKNIFIHIFMNFDELNINYEIILSIISKKVSTLRRLFDYAILKFTSSALGINLWVWNVFLQVNTSMSHIIILVYYLTTTRNYSVCLNSWYRPENIFCGENVTLCQLVCRKIIFAVLDVSFLQF